MTTKKAAPVKLDAEVAATGDTPPEPGTVRLFDENEIHRVPETEAKPDGD